MFFAGVFIVCIMFGVVHPIGVDEPIVPPAPVTSLPLTDWSLLERLGVSIRIKSMFRLPARCEPIAAAFLG